MFQKNCQESDVRCENGKLNVNRDRARQRDRNQRKEERNKGNRKNKGDARRTE